jgi:hypothetical protein
MKSGTSSIAAECGCFHLCLKMNFCNCTVTGGVPAFLIKLDRSGAWHEDMAGMDPLDPSQRRVDLIGCLEGSYKVPPTVKLAPWPGHRS